jgi:hypothetical protein
LIEHEVRFKETARRQVHREKTWWLENRDHSEMFSMEVESAIRILKSGPELSTALVAGARMSPSFSDRIELQ